MLNIYDRALLYIYIYIYIYIYKPNTSERSGCDIRSVLKAEFNRFELIISFILIGYHTKVKEHCLPNYLTTARGKIIACIPFPEEFALSQMQTASFRIWIRVTVSVAYDYNHFPYIYIYIYIYELWTGLVVVLIVAIFRFQFRKEWRGQLSVSHLAWLYKKFRWFQMP